MAPRFDCDVFVAGGGPAGLAVAIAARQQGLSVLLADHARPPIDKACGEGILPAGVSALRQLGIELSPDKFSAEKIGFAFEGIRFVAEHGNVSARFPRGLGIGLRRTALHEQMVKRAVEAGVDLRWGTRVNATAYGEISLDGHVLRSRFVVGADGQNSALRRRLRMDAERVKLTRFGFRRHYRIEPWSPYVEVHWADCGQMYVTPVSSDEICVAFITRRDRLRFSEALPRFRELERRLRDCEIWDREVGALTVTRCLQTVRRGTTALVGEAAGSIDAVTGEGLSLAFQQALALAKAVKTDNLKEYEVQHRHILRLPRFMSQMMLMMDEHPKVRRQAFRAFSATPGAFAELLALHTGAIPPLAINLPRMVHFGWHLLSARA